MVTIVGVRFKPAGKIYYFDPGDLPIEKGADVIVETTRGIECGRVVVGPKQVAEDDVVLPLKEVMRIATEADRAVVEENRRRAKQAMGVFREKVAKHGLEMKRTGRWWRRIAGAPSRRWGCFARRWRSTAWR